MMMFFTIKVYVQNWVIYLERFIDKKVLDDLLINVVVIRV